jgi:CheY-like chemotaxis protein
MAESGASQARSGILLSDDLIFTSRVTGTGRDLGLAVRAARSTEVLQEVARQERPACVILDLANPGLKIAELVSGLRESVSPMPFVVAYGSHVDTATLKSAREAGCDLVLPRSKFVEELPRALTDWLRPRATN